MPSAFTTGSHLKSV